MNSSQRRDCVFRFNLLNPSLSYKVDKAWRRDVLKDINIFISDKKELNLDIAETLPKMDKEKDWNDFGVMELLGKCLGSNK
ncbi:hypothetical protein pb186bvf_001589 [Paramecium bursaria]